MAHVTFIHGVANKPAEADLLRIWRGALKKAAVPLDLSAEGISSEMVYWADVLHASPIPTSEYQNGDEAVVSEANDEYEESLAPIEFSGPDDAEWTKAMARRLGVLSEIYGTQKTLETGRKNTVSSELERIPLPGFVKDAFLKRFLKDVHHYLFNVEFSPRSGERYRVQDEIKKRFLQAIDRGSVRGAPHIVVSHSMGTVIAYDCLKRVSECPPVDGFITLGSPLGIDEVQDKLQPGWTRQDGYPSDTLKSGWENYFDKLDVVSRLDPYLANDYRHNNIKVVADVPQANDGVWRHDITKYLMGKEVSEAISRALNIGT